MLALLILVGGLLYLGRYEERLIQQELQSLQSEATIFAAALVEGALEDSPDSIGQELNELRSAQIVRRLYETTETRIRLFGQEGELMADSRIIGGPGGVVEVEPLLPRERDNWLKVAFDKVYETVTWLLPQRKRLPDYRETPDQHATDYASVSRALLGQVGRQVWSAQGRGLVLGVAVPVQPLREVVGAVLVTRDTRAIEEAMQSVRADILRVFAVALAITVFLSIYLAGTVTRPIRRLALAAEQPCAAATAGQVRRSPTLTRQGATRSASLSSDAAGHDRAPVGADGTRSSGSHADVAARDQEPADLSCRLGGRDHRHGSPTRASSAADAIILQGRAALAWPNPPTSPSLRLDRPSCRRRRWSGADIAQAPGECWPISTKARLGDGAAASSCRWAATGWR